MGLLNKFYAVSEPALGLLSGAVAEPVAGWAGLLSGGSKQAVENTRNALTYQPRTAAGTAGQNALANALLGVKTAMVDQNPPVRMAVEGYNALADRAGLLSPALGAAVKTAPTAAMLFAGPGSAQTRQAFANVGKDTAKYLAPKAGQMAENYMRKTGGLLAAMPDEYGIEHRPMKVDGGAAPLHDLAPVFGDDVYGKNALQYFGSGDPREAKVLQMMRQIRGNPDAMVTVYRGVPDGVDKINPGDWVTIHPEVAADYGRVVQMQVPASHITSWPDSLLEFGYWPK